MASTRDPFDVTLSPEKRADLTTRLVEEIRTGKQARSLVMEDNGLIDFAYALYEQRSQQPISKDSPDYGDPDLTSPIGTENVDSLSARAAQSIFKLDPLWIVEGIGPESAKKAPTVETYMQFRQEEMRFQKVAKRGITACLVETGSVLEVCEDAERSVTRETVTAKLQRNPDDNTILLDGKTGKPLPMLDEDGYPVPAEPDDLEAGAFVEVHHVYPDFKRRGAYVRRRSMKDFMMLPNHAEDDHEVWGHATRFWLTTAEVQRRVDDGDFDPAILGKLGGDTMERQQTPEADRVGVQVLYTPGQGNAEHEFWKVQLWLDLGQGFSFYTAIVSELHSCVARLKADWLPRFRTVYVNPYPCPYSVYGYSMVFTKLGTTIEEHTAWRNMNAKRSTIKSNTPMKILTGAQYDPTIQPFGAGEFIRVGNMNEIEPFEYEDVTPQAMNKEGQCVADAQRVIGFNDIAIGQLSPSKRTLGENEMATRASFTRTDDPIANIQEAFEEVGALIHAIEVQTLKEMADDASGGITAPAGALAKLQGYSADPSFDGTFTADMISGEYRFKPRGSSDASDPNLRKKNLNDLVQSIEVIAKVNPSVQARVASEEFGTAYLQMLVEEYKPRDRDAFLKPLAQPPMAPGLPPGAPPMPPAGAPSFGGADLVAQLTGGAQ